MDLNGIGVWSPQLRFGDPDAIGDAAAELDELGWGSLWIPDAGGSVLDGVDRLLSATRRALVATGILNIWMHQPSEIARGHADLTATHGDRFLAGLGVSHRPIVDAQPELHYRRPLEAMRAFLDGLDSAASPLAARHRVIGALGPRMTDLALHRTAGVHPYLVPVEHVRRARETLGAGALLVPEVKVTLESDVGTARALGRDHLGPYLELPNYANNLRRLGYTESDLAGGGSDRLVDDVLAWGGPEAARARVRAHLDAGADSAVIQVLTGKQDLPREEWRVLAPALVDLAG